MRPHRLPQVLLALIILACAIPCRAQMEPELKTRLTEATVYIETQLTLSSRDWVGLPDEARQQMGTRPSDPASGSGFLITNDGYIITNAHVIEGITFLVQYDINAKQLQVRSMDSSLRPQPFNADNPTDPFTLTFNSSGIKVVVRSGMKEEKTYTPSVVRVDKDIDLALLKIGGAEDFTFLDLAPDFEVESGTYAIMSGFPGGAAPDIAPFIKESNASQFENKNPRISINQGSVTSVREHEGEKRYQMAIGANHGNSGGPITNLDGAVIGVLYAGIDQMQNINYAIPTKYISHVCNSDLRYKLGLADAPEDNEETEADNGDQSFDDFLDSSDIDFGDN